MRMTDEDIAIMNRFNWIPYEQEHSTPTASTKIQDVATGRCLSRTRHNNQKHAHQAMREFYAFL